MRSSGCRERGGGLVVGRVVIDNWVRGGFLAMLGLGNRTFRVKVVGWAFRHKAIPHWLVRSAVLADGLRRSLEPKGRCIVSLVAVADGVLAALNPEKRCRLSFGAVEDGSDCARDLEERCRVSYRT